MNSKTAKLLRAASAITRTPYKDAKRAWLKELKPNRGEVRQWLLATVMKGLAQ